MCLVWKWDHPDTPHGGGNIVLSNTGRYTATEVETRVQVRDALRGELLLDEPAYEYECAFSPDDLYFVAGCGVWSTTTSDQPIARARST
jgi:hypothetical protein